MEIKLQKLTIRNFKGFKEFVFEPNGESVNVSGDNGTGKTSLYDSFLWVLFGKDSTDKQKFDWKPLDDNGNEINHLETSVEAILIVDEKEQTISRSTTEDWGKKRGRQVDSYTGHTTVYQLNGLDVKKSEFENYIAKLIDTDKFKMLSNLDYFPNVLDWKERRRVLIDMVGDISSDQVIDTNKELEPLRELLSNEDASTLLEITNQKRRKLNKQIENIEPRMDEVNRAIPDLSDLDKDLLVKEADEKVKEIERLRGNISDIKNGFAVSKYKDNLRDLNTEFKEAEDKYNSEQANKLIPFRDKIADIKEKLSEKLSEQATNDIVAKSIKLDIELLERKIKTLEDENETNKKRFFDIKEETMSSFDIHQTECPTCGQTYPSEKLDEIKINYEDEVARFNINKSSRLEKINELGRDNKAKIESMRQEIKDFESQIEIHESVNIKETIAKLREDLTQAEKEYKEQQELAGSFYDTEDYASITKSIDDIQMLMDEKNISTEDLIKVEQKQINQLSQEYEILKDSLYQFTLQEKQIERREELIEEEKQLTLEYGVLDQRKLLLEQFNEAKAHLLTRLINDKFKYVKFKLFETAINGELKETCEVTVGGKNYSTGLNNAGKVNAGLDIINTLMDHYGVYTPVWIDNAESVNQLIDINSQLITLTVSKYKNLRVGEI